MDTVRANVAVASILALLTACTSTPRAPEPGSTGLSGTSWRLVRFESSDDSGFAPDDRDQYTVAFTGTNEVSVRVDCNRGHGTWKSTGGNGIEFGPLALTRAMCAPGSHSDDVANRWAHIRSYSLKNGHLFLSVQADGGVFEFEPATSK
jgi:para-nitrobenzyl esterase